MSVITPSRQVAADAARCALCLTFAACGGDQAVAPLVTDSGTTGAYASMAFTASIDLQRRNVIMVPPSRAMASTAVRRVQPAQLSILGSDAIRLVPSNVRVSPVGAFTPNQVRVTFDVAIENRFATLALTTPTWPMPPAPAVILFPLDYTVTRSPGGVTGGSGNTIDVSVPSFGSVIPSSDWNGTGEPGSGAPYNFFAQTACGTSVTRDCFRWVAFPTWIRPKDARVTRTVGFDVDASVQQVRSRMLVAADLVPLQLAAP